MNNSENLFLDDSEPDLAKIALSRAAYIETRDNFGGGVQVVSGLVITTWHFLKRQGRQIKVNGQDAEIVYTSRTNDLAALTFANPRAMPWIRFCTKCRAEDKVLYIAPIRVKKKIRLIPSPVGTVTYVSKDSICASMLTSLGSCGSGLWGKQGLLGMVSSDEDIDFIQAIPSQTLRQFSAKAYRILKDLKKNKKEGTQNELPFERYQDEFQWQ